MPHPRIQFRERNNGMRREQRHDIGVGNQGHIVGGLPVKAKSLEVGPTGLEGDDFLCRCLACSKLVNGEDVSLLTPWQQR